MKRKHKKISTFLAEIAGAFICMVLIYEAAKDFFLGFLAGYNEVSFEYASENYLSISIICGAVTAALMIIAIIICFFSIRKKVTIPIERLAKGMQELSRGDFSVRVPADSEFEIYQMENAFNSMAAELEAARLRTEEQARREKLLYASVAHDLKTPMTMIIGYAKLLQSKGDISDEQRQGCLDTIIRQTSHANRLLDAMLSYSKLTGKTYELDIKTGDIAELLRTSAADCYASFERAGFDVDIRIRPENLEYPFDMVEMKRVFYNLLGNMLRHNSGNTACIIQLTEKADTIEIVFADNGNKISPEIQDILFDPFAVGDTSRNTRNGSGLGLSICRKIIERHSGSICYVNEWEGEFKAFVITLPLLSEADC